MVKALSPMMATSAARLPVGREWSSEEKGDGCRAQALKAGTTVSLASRNLKNITRQFPAVAEAVSRVGARTAVIDGEIVALDTDGRPFFQALHHWSLAGLSSRSPLRGGRGTAAGVPPPSAGCAPSSGPASCGRSSVATYGPLVVAQPEEGGVT